MSNVISLEPYTAKARDIQIGKDFRDWLITEISSIKTSDDESEDIKINTCEAIHKLFQVLIESTDDSPHYAGRPGKGSE